VEARAGPRARAGLLANSGCFVSKCVLWCFVVFCGCFVMFCGCFAVFCECFAAFPQNTQNTRKTSKNTEKQEKLTIRSCIAGVFQEPKISTVLHETLFTKHLQNTAKHRKTPQNSHKTRFVKLRRKTPQNKNAKRSRLSQKVAIQPQYVLRAFGVCFKDTLDLSRKHTIQNTQYTRKLRGGVTYPQGVT